MTAPDAAEVAAASAPGEGESTAARAPQGEGPAGGVGLCDAAGRVLEGRSLTLPAGGHDLVIEAGDSQPPSLDRRWWMSAVVFRFRYCETR